MVIVSLIGIRPLIFAIWEVDLSIQNDLKAITNYNRVYRVHEFWYYPSGFELH